MEPGHFQNTIVLWELETWDLYIFQKSQIFKISCSSHSKNARIQLNGFQSIFGGWGGPPFIFYGPEWPKVRKWTPPELFIHLGGMLDIETEQSHMPPHPFHTPFHPKKCDGSIKIADMQQHMASGI